MKHEIQFVQAVLLAQLLGALAFHTYILGSIPGVSVWGGYGCQFGQGVFFPGSMIHTNKFMDFLHQYN